jgi:protein-glutamine gamma-glutamyltransferase
MVFNTYFKASSYAMIAVAALALALSGGLHVSLAFIFAAVIVLAWKIEGTRWQLSERVGLVMVLLSIPLFFLDWRYQKAIGEPVGRLGVNALAHLIVFLSVVKLLQVKSDRDWVFLYLISFFELLLAAGLSFSPLFLVMLSLYLFCALSTVIAFEIRKARRTIPVREVRLLVPPDSAAFKRLAAGAPGKNSEARRLPIVAGSLLILIGALALPLFLVAPRAGSAAISLGGAGLTNFIGFSESVTLGEIGTLKRNNEIVMHVRVEEPQRQQRELRWRGVALDEFTGGSWKKSAEARRSEQKPLEAGLFKLGTTEALHRLTTQTVFLEPIESSVLFAAFRAVAIQGDLPFIRVDEEGSIQSHRHDTDRIIYKALSDTTESDPAILRKDDQPTEASSRYLQRPSSTDGRIADLARSMIANAHARNHYDAAKAIETQLQRDYAYSLEMKASGPDPLADFLFNVRAGHCEYFSTAMAVMLRTQGIPARVVNGFLPGEYNEAAGAFTIRQSDAHSWVEVYFPGTNSWVTFDPTPVAGRTESVSSGLGAQLGKYAEALELIWFQYVVGYDRQEQRSLATSLHNKFFDYQRSIAEGFAVIKKKLPSTVRPAILVALSIVTLLLLLLVVRRMRLLGWRQGLSIARRKAVAESSAIDFYQRLLALLARRGMQRESYLTPLEFAGSVDLSAVLAITQAYNRVRFGGEQLSTGELRDIDRALGEFEDSAK